jgi:PAS domain S-box-containing protein
MEEIPLYNSRLVNNYLEYLKKFYPSIDVGSLIRGAGINTYQLEDGGHWFTQAQLDRFHELLMEKTGNANISREVGQYLPFSKASGAVTQYALGFVTPSAAYSVLGKLYPHVSRASILKSKMIAANKMEIDAIPKQDVSEKPYQCENRMGTLEAIAKLFTSKFAQIDHPVCLHRGGEYCKYILTWEESPAGRWKRLKNYLFLLGFILSAGILWHFQPPHWDSMILVYILMYLVSSTYTLQLEKTELLKNIKDQGDSAERYLNQINQRYNEAMLVREIGQATSMILDIDKLLPFVMEALEKRLDFDRGMIMLANKDRTHLVYNAGYGYQIGARPEAKRIEFHLDNPGSKGVVVEAFRQQKPFLVDNISEVEGSFSERSRDVARQMGVSSFICIPIVFEKESLGVLMVDNILSKRPLTESDMSLLSGIATQVAISITNATSFQRTRTSEERFRALSENAPDIIYTTDNTGAVSYLNPAWERVLGHTMDETIGKYFVTFARPEDVKCYIKIFKEIRDEKKHVSGIDGTILHKNGTKRLFNMSGAPNLDAEGNVIGVVGTFRDITIQRTLENQLLHASKMEAVGTLTGGIAHDFNNIIQAISGYNQLLMMNKDELDPDWRYLSNIDQLNQRATDLIKQLLIFSRKVDSKLQPIDLNEEIKRYYNLLKETIPKMISVDLMLDANLWKIKGDPIQLGQVIMNLSVNARDAMTEGGRIQIQTKNIEIEEKKVKNGIELNPGRYVLLRLSDTGHGMTKETIPHIFEPFYSTKEAGKGTGLGLAVVYGIISNHSGHINCDSEPEKGTTFNMYFPALSLLDESAAVSEHREDNEKSAVNNEIILLVDDEEYLLETNKTLLEGSGYRVLTAENGEKAIEIFKRENKEISLVILDLLMPGMGGIKCLTGLLKNDPDAKIIISSGYITSEKQSEVLSKGAVGFIQKPYRHQDLLKMVRGFLS